MTTPKTSSELDSIAQADKLLKDAEDAQISRVNDAIEAAFLDLRGELKRRWSKHSSGSTFATDRAVLLANELKSVINVLDPKSKRTKRIKRQLRELLKTVDENGTALADEMIKRYPETGITVESTVSAQIDVLGQVSDEAYERLLGHGQQYARDASVIIQQGIIQGWGVNKTARALAERLSVPKNRAETIVRTETSKGQNRAAKNRYKESGIDLIMAVETQDDRVCPYCANRAGKIYPIDAYEVTKHPNCRGYSLPVKEEWIELGLVDFEWANEHHAATVKLAGSSNGALTPFEKASGLTAPPKPFWRPGQKVPGVAPLPVKKRNAKHLRGEPIDTGELLPKSKRDDFISAQGENDFERLQNGDEIAKSMSKEGLPPGLRLKHFRRDHKIVKEVQLEGGGSIDVGMYVDSSGIAVDTYSRPRARAIEALKRIKASVSISWGEDAQSGSGSPNFDLKDSVKTERDRKRVALAAKRIWPEVLSRLPDGTLVNNAPIGGAGSTRDSAYQKMGFGRVDDTGYQYGVVEGGKLRPIEFFEPSPDYSKKIDAIQRTIDSGSITDPEVLAFLRSLQDEQ